MTVGQRARRGALSLAALLLVSCVTPQSKPFVLPEAHSEPDVIQVRHRVESGQTLYRIAKTYGLTVDELMQANDIDDPRELKVGEELLIPGVAEVRKVTVADSPEPEARASNATQKSANDKPEKKPTIRPAVTVGRAEGIFDWPLKGVLYARFGKKGKEPHDGIDLSAPAGSPVKTAAPGTVLFAGEQKGYGLIVIVEHDSNLITLYAHNRDVRVKTGQKVRDDQVVATVGDSGKTSGPHLHFEVRKNGAPVDPLDYLKTVPK